MIRPRIFTVFALLLSAFVLVITSICFGAGKILFEEDWEEGKIDEKVWIPAATWSVIDGVMDATGGGEGFTVQNDFTDFEFSADCKIVNAYNGFLMRVQDAGNLYMHQVGVGDGNVWWHSKIGGSYAADQRPIESGLIPEKDVWYRMKFIVEGDTFTYLMAELGEELNEAEHLVGTWEHDAFDSGAIGFRHSGAEHAQYDNVLVTTIGYTKAVTPEGNLSTTWGSVKLHQR
jgi:hypothetical protein